MFEVSVVLGESDVVPSVWVGGQSVEGNQAVTEGRRHGCALSPLEGEAAGGGGGVTQKKKDSDGENQKNS